MALWHHVTLTPEDTKIIVFKRGTSQGLKGWTPNGGHCEPSSILGDNLEWKNAQKKETKKKTSEVINKIIPAFKPLETILLCSPWLVLSRETSRHHVKETKIRYISLKIKNSHLLWLLNQDPNLIVNLKAMNEVIIGHGEFSTIWKGWLKKDLIIKDFCFFNFRIRFYYISYLWRLNIILLKITSYFVSL